MNSITSIIRSFTFASIATVLTAVLAWAVIDSTTKGPRDDLATVQTVGHALERSV